MTTPGARLCVIAGLLGTLGLLLRHAIHYAFLTDDAFISFRYARNLSEGYGLVFNPGFERVEGYTNFMWVVILAGFNAIGLAPESVANILSMGLTIGLWGVVTWFVCRTSPAPGKTWLVLIAPLCLGATRSVAVWSTSGLETRLFEVLVVGGVFRLIVEIESWMGEGQDRRPLSGALFGLATLTRPDGLLIGIACFGTAGLVLVFRSGFTMKKLVIPMITFGTMVGAHYLFRRSYYGAWLPNTYYAKVDGRTWWDMGFAYLGCFLLEYAAYLWIPLLIAAALYHRGKGTSYVPLFFGAIVIPHAFYVASVGGDHFEYRPLDLYFPFAFILLYDGAKYLARGGWRSGAVGAYVLVVVIGLVELPLQSHLQIPKTHVGGFPGEAGPYTGSTDFMRPERDPVYRFPGLRRVAAAHLSLLRTTTGAFVGIRQEEHKAFLAKVIPEGKQLRALVEDGVLPEDMHLAISCVGAIPYYSHLRTLDRLGLTDAHVAHSGFMKVKRLMAHDKNATIEYAREVGVDFWAVDAVHSIWDVTHPKFLTFFQKGVKRDLPLYAARVGESEFLLGTLPLGEEKGKERFKSLTFERVTDPNLRAEIVEAAKRRLREKLKANPTSHDARLQYGNVLLFSGDFEGALGIYLEEAKVLPDQMGLWQNIGSCYQMKGDWGQAIDAVERAIALAEASGDEPVLLELESRLRQYRNARPAAEENGSRTGSGSGR